MVGVEKAAFPAYVLHPRGEHALYFLYVIDHAASQSSGRLLADDPGRPLSVVVSWQTTRDDHDQRTSLSATTADDRDQRTSLGRRPQTTADTPRRPRTRNHVFKEELPPSLDSSSPVNSISSLNHKSHSQLRTSRSNALHYSASCLLPTSLKPLFSKTLLSCRTIARTPEAP